MDLYIGPGQFAMHNLSMPERKRPESEQEDLLLQATPYETRDGRPYLRGAPYFLPCDLPELHRQSLQTMLFETIFSGPTCTSFQLNRPKQVLEVGCGSGFWSSTCHDHFRSHGHDDVSFTGIDLVSLAPELQKQGMRWNFVQHDLRKFPWPFPDGGFDYVMVKDISLAITVDIWQRFLDECVRVLGEDGTIEVWESDHILRCLTPQDQAPLADENTRTYPITSTTTFGSAQNRFIQDANAWIEKACEHHRLPSRPCGKVAEMLSQETDSLHKAASRRVAVPLNVIPWENASSRRPSATSHKSKGKVRAADGSLDPNQAAIRHTALMTVIQKVESLEPVLKEGSGKNKEEWASWWAGMMSSLLEQNGASSGECLELGTWWATKRRRVQ
ncbi:hypothetical protein ANO11243_012540 [Dothideomycetidae sp. 11243]|nr:hypothetical protein ANO11243_012540 [fungal sp. No.11243]